MKFKTLTGGVKRVRTPKKYLIDWNAASKSKFQRRVKIFLKTYWVNDVVFEEFPVSGTRLSVDFYNANKNIAVEAQGDQHIKYVPFFHQNKGNYLHQLRKDRQKEEFCKLNDITLVEIFQEEEINEELFAKYDIIL